MFVKKIVIGAVSAALSTALLVAGPAQAAVQVETAAQVQENVAQSVQKIAVSDDPFVTPVQGVTGRGFDLRWEAIQHQAKKAGIDTALCGTDTRERAANVVASIGATDDGVPREYYAVTNSTGQLVEVIAREIIVQNDDTEPVTEKGRYCNRLPFVPGAGNGFDRGHVIADSLGGESNVYNLVPQNATLNRHGDQAFIEDQIRKAGGAADFHAVLTYPDVHSDIPSRYSIAYSLEDTPRVRTFANIDPDSAGLDDAYEVISPTDDMYVFVGDSDKTASSTEVKPTESETVDNDTEEELAVSGSALQWIVVIAVLLSVVGVGAAAWLCGLV